MVSSESRRGSLTEGSVYRATTAGFAGDSMDDARCEQRTSNDHQRQKHLMIELGPVELFAHWIGTEIGNTRREDGDGLTGQAEEDRSDP